MLASSFGLNLMRFEYIAKKEHDKDSRGVKDQCITQYK